MCVELEFYKKEKIIIFFYKWSRNVCVKLKKKKKKRKDIFFFSSSPSSSCNWRADSLSLFSFNPRRQPHRPISALTPPSRSMFAHSVGSSIRRLWVSSDVRPFLNAVAGRRAQRRCAADPGVPTRLAVRERRRAPG